MAGHWDNYWAEGHLTSFCGDFSENYEDEYSNFWKSQYLSLAENSKTLDLATGNLALPLLGLAIPKDDIDYFAVDLSEISKHTIIKAKPDLEASVEKIQLFDKTSIEQLPFEDGSFDLVTSMYGFEYARIDKTLPEIARVLKPGGKFIAISHIPESIILVRNNQSFDCINEMVAREGALEILQKLSKSIGYIPDNFSLGALKANRKTEKLRKNLNTKLEALDKLYRDIFWETGVPALIQGFFSQLVGSHPKAREEAISNKIKELKKHRMRLEDLKNAALTSQDLESIKAISNDNNFHDVDFVDFQRDGSLVGKKIVLKR